MAKADLSADRLRELLHYDPETGVFTWRVNRKRVRAGDAAGSIQTRGYWQIRIRPGNYTAHRLAWLHIYGEWPTGEVDHINGNKLDNRICNLRDVPKRVNGQNRRTVSAANKSSKLIGAHGNNKPFGKPWRSSIRYQGRVIGLGSFDTEIQAHEAYVSAKRQLHEGCTI